MTVLWVPTMASPEVEPRGQKQMGLSDRGAQGGLDLGHKAPIGPHGAAQAPPPLAEVCVTWFLPVSDFTSQLPS